MISNHDKGIRRINFMVMGPNDAYISLSPQKYDTENMYEIILGARRGKYSAIKRCIQCKDKIKVDVTLSKDVFIRSDEWRSFWIEFGDERKVKLGREGEEPFLVMDDLKEVPIRYVGLATKNGVLNHFKFCDLGKLELSALYRVHKLTVHGPYWW